MAMLQTKKLQYAKAKYVTDITFHLQKPYLPNGSYQCNLPTGKYIGMAKKMISIT